MPTTSLNSKILLLPLGSFEQHGPHLPLDTDTIIIDSVVTRALRELQITGDELRRLLRFQQVTNMQVSPERSAQAPKP